MLHHAHCWLFTVAAQSRLAQLVPSKTHVSMAAEVQKVLLGRRVVSGKLSTAVLIATIGFLLPRGARGAACVSTEPVAATCLANGQRGEQAGMVAMVYSGQAERGMEFREGVPVPKVGPNQVLLRVHAAAINPVDYKKPTVPLANKLLAPENSIVGIDVSGTIIEMGREVSEFSVGDEVFGFAKGSLAEFAVCDASKVALKPTGLSHVQAAGLPTAALTSYQALRDNGLKEGDHLLVLGASGGCGLAGVAIGKALGAHVTGVCSARNSAVVQSMGADSVIDYTLGDAAFAKLSDLDLVLDTVTGSGSPSDPNYEIKMRATLKPGRLYVALNSGLGDWLRLLASKVTGWRRLFQRSDYDLVVTDQNGKDLAILAEWAVNGQLRMPIDSVYELDAASVHRAFTKLQSRRVVGKLVVQAIT